VLGSQSEPRATGHQHLHAGSGGQEISNERGRGQDVLEVVEQEQEVPLPQILRHGLLQTLPRLLTQPEGRRGRRGDERRIRQPRQIDQEGAIGKRFK
jgi:hypothetical protein